MFMRNWLQALCAFVCVVALTACGGGDGDGDECTNPSDCQTKKGPPPPGQEYICNDKHTCELQDTPPSEVKCSPTCAGTEFCDISSGTGVCRTCSATQGCAAPLFCDAAANNGKGVCKACSDTAQGTGTDQGCSAAAPVCDTTASNGSGVCKACTDTATGNGTDLGCSATAPVCDAAASNGAGLCRACVDSAQGNGLDVGCSATAPVCDAAASNGAGLCKACVDSATGNGLDVGCSATTPVCDTTAASGAGVCKACTDTATGNGTDLGCSAAAPICNTSAASGAGACRACTDTATGNGTDLGCSDTAPICNASAANGVGLCRACVDSATGNGTDLGCSATLPLCDAAASNGAGVCKACLDSATGNGTDQGCSATLPLCDAAASNGSGVCRACVDSASGNGTDVGCSASVPICDATAASGAGTCKVCLDTATSGNTDLGCSAPTALCEPTADNGLGTCKVCVTSSNEGCPGVQTCNATGTACEGCADNTSCTNASTPICKPPPPVSVCVECTTNAHCGVLRPVCDTATNFCGCTSDASCASAPGNTDFCNTAANNGRGECQVCLTDANCVSADPSHPFCELQSPQSNQTVCAQCRVNTDCPLTQVCNPNHVCVAPPGADPATTSGQIQSFIDKPVGTLTPPLTIENAFVTYIKPALGTDVAGFFLQAQPDGPAMFVAVDASTLGLAVGDRITLTVGEVLKLSGDLEAAATVTNVSIVARGYPVQNLSTAARPGLAVDRSSATDLQSNLPAYESELISLTGTIASASATSGTGHVAFGITTAGVTTANNTFKLRLPDTLADSLDIALGCGFTLKAGPLWRFTTTSTATPPVVTTNTQPSAYYASDLVISGCPAPKLLKAAPSSLTQLTLTFDRRIDPATVSSDGAQFTFNNGLSATAPQVNGRQITLTTSMQSAGTDYTVTVAASVKDLLGTSVSATANTATFKGYRVPAVLRITEVQPNAGSSADLVELLAVSGGTVEGFLLQQDANSPTTLATLPNATVATGDIMVVHLTPAAGYASETTAKNQFPSSTTAVNYDTAWDFAGGATGITYSSRVLAVKDSVGTLQDAVPFISTTGTPPAAFPANLQTLQAAGLWLPADCGGALCTTSSSPTAAEVSADWTGLKNSSLKTDPTVHRTSNATETNTKNDWVVGPQSWGQ